MTTSLSILIPTYNRSNYLNRLLKSILENVDDINPDFLIEVIVLDNASQDDTLSVASSFQGKIPNLSIVSRKINIGYPRNLYDGFLNKANYKYALAMGDDDYFFPGAINYIMNVIRMKDFSLLTYRSLGSCNYQLSRNLPKFDHDFLSLRPTEFLFKTVNLITLISGTIVNREVCDYNKLKSSLDGHLPQLPFYLSCLSSSLPAVFIDDYLIGVEAENSGGGPEGYKWVDVFCSEYLSHFLNCQLLLDIKNYQRFLKLNLMYHFPPYIIRSSKAEMYSFNKCLKKYDYEPSLFTSFYFSLLNSPPFINKPIFFLIYFFSSLLLGDGIRVLSILNHKIFRIR